MSGGTMRMRVLGIVLGKGEPCDCEWLWRGFAEPHILSPLCQLLGLLPALEGISPTNRCQTQDTGCTTRWLPREPSKAT